MSTRFFLPAKCGTARVTLSACGELTAIDAAILSRFAAHVRTEYRLADLFDSMRAVSALRVCGSIINAVGNDEACARLRERRALELA